MQENVDRMEATFSQLQSYEKGPDPLKKGTISRKRYLRAALRVSLLVRDGTNVNLHRLVSYKTETKELNGCFGSMFR